MILGPLFKLVEERFPASKAHVEDEVWKLSRPLFCEQWQRIAQEILDAALLTIPTWSLKGAVQEVLSSRTLGVSVCEFRIRPGTKYYEQTGQVLPAPENPKGSAAAGVELELSLCRGYDSGGAFGKPRLEMEFRIWGDRERLAFGHLLHDHRRAVHRLIEQHELRLFTSCVFGNIELHKGKDHARILDLYYRNEHDPENTFTLGRSFGATASLADLTATMRGLITLYASAYGYCAKSRDRDVMFALLGTATR